MIILYESINLWNILNRYTRLAWEVWEILIEWLKYRNLYFIDDTFNENVVGDVVDISFISSMTTQWKCHLRFGWNLLDVSYLFHRWQFPWEFRQRKYDHRRWSMNMSFSLHRWQFQWKRRLRCFWRVFYDLENSNTLLQI